MKRSNPRPLVLATLAAYLLQAAPLHAAESNLESMVSRFKGQAAGLPEVQASEYVLRKYPGEKLIPVRLLGGVNRPGVYYLPEGTDLLTAISLSSGLTDTADVEKVHHARGAKPGVNRLTMDDMLADPKKNPVLAANDLVMVEEKQPILSNNTMLLITALSGIVGITLGAIAISKVK